MDAMMEIDNIGKKFNDQYILQNIKLTINKGEMVALVGKSGSGKTTLLNILGLISAPSSGRYKIKGKSINSINSKQAMILRRNTIGYLFQNYGLIDDETVELNAGDFMRIAPSAKRQFFAGNDSEISFVCIQVKENSLEGYTADDAVIAE